jgi:hypothetical protein
MPEKDREVVHRPVPVLIHYAYPLQATGRSEDKEPGHNASLTSLFQSQGKLVFLAIKFGVGIKST